MTSRTTNALTASAALMMPQTKGTDPHTGFADDRPNANWTTHLNNPSAKAAA